MKVLKQSGAYYSGTNESAEQQKKVLIVEKNGIKIAMLAYTMDLNGQLKEYHLENEKYLVNVVPFNDEVCDISLVEEQVKEAKKQSADFIIAFCHWGWEFEMYPHNNIVQVAQKMMALGVDAILGNHPHVSQPMQRFYSRPDIEPPFPDGLIVYAYGDFVSFHPESRNSKIAYITKFDIVKGTLAGISMQRTFLTNLQFLPIYILNEKLPDGSYDCRILKFKEVYEHPDRYGLTDLERSQLEHLNDVVLRQILLPENAVGILAE